MQLQLLQQQDIGIFDISTASAKRRATLIKTDRRATLIKTDKTDTRATWVKSKKGYRTAGSWSVDDDRPAEGFG